jgi:hypothetical protein
VPDRSNAQAQDGRVCEVASRLFAALLTAGRVNETNQPGIIRYCVRAAQQLVQEADEAVQAAGEPAQSVADALASLDLDLDIEVEEPAKPEGTAYRSGPAPTGSAPTARPTAPMARPTAPATGRKPTL